LSAVLFGTNRGRFDQPAVIRGGLVLMNLTPLTAFLAQQFIG
jgi:hypothetical protein